MIVKLLTEHHLEFLSLKGGCRGSSESTLVKMPNCWKSHVTAQMFCLIQMKLSGVDVQVSQGRFLVMSVRLPLSVRTFPQNSTTILF